MTGQDSCVIQQSAHRVLQADRVKLLELLTNYQLPITGHEGYAKVGLLPKRKHPKSFSACLDRGYC